MAGRENVNVPVFACRAGEEKPWLDSYGSQFTGEVATRYGTILVERWPIQWPDVVTPVYQFLARKKKAGLEARPGVKVKTSRGERARRMGGNIRRTAHMGQQR